MEVVSEPTEPEAALAAIIDEESGLAELVEACREAERIVALPQKSEWGGHEPEPWAAKLLPVLRAAIAKATSTEGD